MRVSTSCGERIAERFADRFEDVRLLVPYDEGSVAVGSLRARRADRRARDTDEGVVIRAKLPHRDVRRFAAYLVADAAVGDGRRTRDRARGDAAARRCRAAVAGLPGRRRPRSRRLRAGHARRRASAPSCRPGIAVAIPEGHAGLVTPRSGLAARHGISRRQRPRPDRLRLPRRAQGDPAQHRRQRAVHGRARDADRAARARPGRRRPARRGRASSPAPPRGGRARLVGDVRPEPRIRVSAILRWHGGILLCRHEKRGRENWLLPGGGVRSGETLTEALLPRARGGDGPARGRSTSCRSRARSRSSSRSRPSAASGRSTSSTSSSPATWPARSPTSSRTTRRCAATGSSSPTSSTAIALHPPLQRFLRRWQPGDPCVYLGALWAE